MTDAHEERVEPVEEAEPAPERDPLAAVTRERDDYLDALQRLKAEFDNYRKRVARDQQELAARAHERLVKELVPVLDDLERALEAAAQHEEAKLEEGVALVHRSLADLLAREGLAEVSTDGRFDPHVAGGTALAAVRGGRGNRDPGAAEGLRARRPRPAAGARRHLRRPAAGERWLSRSTSRSASPRTRARTS